MKKLFSIILAICLLAFSACAEAPEVAKEPELRTRILETEFGTLELNETAYTYENYSLWYQEGLLKPCDYYGHADFRPVDAQDEDRSFSYLIVSSEIAPEQLDQMLIEATGGYDDTWTIAMHREFTTDAGNRILSVDANNGLEIHRYYLVQGEETSLFITAIYPADIPEETILYLDLMTKTIEFVNGSIQEAE